MVELINHTSNGKNSLEGFPESSHKYGLHKILEPFMKDLNILATTGVQVRVDGIERTYKGLS